jgi:site-specific recombinase XerD
MAGQPAWNNRPRTEPGPRRRWFEEGELICAQPGCGNRLPAGYYGKTKRIFLCSPMCTIRFYGKSKHARKCLCCGKKFIPTNTERRGNFCCIEHYALWRRRQTDEKKFGRFAALVAEFVEAIVPRHLSESARNQLRYDLAAFFSFLRSRRIRSLNKVGPQLISAFLVSLEATRPKSYAKASSSLAWFFDWLRMTGRRKAANPVVARFHSQRKSERLPRPYSAREMKVISSLVEASGDPQLKLALAIGSESGLRISEVCNLRLSDIELVQQQIFVRLPNKTRQERLVPFHVRTQVACGEWLRQRPEVAHDFVFVDSRGNPMRKHTLRSRFNRLLTGPGKLASWSFHRLRHVAATALYPAMDTTGVMKTLGWRSERVMQGYTRLSTEDLRDSYARAMAEAARREERPETRSESLENYFAGPQAGK